jgi:hypothetical protein
MSFRDFLTTYKDAYLYPIPASIVALATRISPGVSEEEYQSLRSQSINKEISAALSIYQASTFDFRSIMSSQISDRSIPLTSRLFPCEDVASDTYQIFAHSRRILSNMLVYPSCGKKTIGKESAQNFWEHYFSSGCTFKHLDDHSRFDSSDVTPIDCLRLYMETGVGVHGPVEMRIAWTYNQISPRVYYARGGTVLRTSQYLQPVINRIIDLFPEVHRLNRFSAPQDHLSDTDVEVIYDYSSFTSNLYALPDFVQALSEFYAGVPITIVDVRKGPVTIDLGELFHQYNDECNEYASFDASQVCNSGTDPLILEHNCGMLGVEGNIFLCTLLHGIHLRQLSGLRRSKCVGDDARFHYNTGTGRISDDDLEYVSWVLGGAAPINSDKLNLFESEVDPLSQAFRYIKRPLHRDEDIMVEGLLLILPSLIPLLPIADRFHTLYPSPTHPCRSSFKSIVRLLSVLKNNSISESTYGTRNMEMLQSHVRFILREIRRQDPDGVHAPMSRPDSTSNYRIPPVNLWGLITYSEWVLDELMYDELVRFPQRGGADDDWIIGFVGESKDKVPSKHYSFLEKLGYLKSESLFVEESIQSIGPGEMKVYLDNLYMGTKRYTVIREIPTWYFELQGSR